MKKIRPQSYQLRESMKCPSCKSSNIKLFDSEESYARRKPEGEPAYKMRKSPRKLHFCWDCENVW